MTFHNLMNIAYRSTTKDDALEYLLSAVKHVKYNGFSYALYLRLVLTALLMQRSKIPHVC